MRCDRIWRGARLATLDPAREGLGLIDDGVVACHEGRIVWVGPAAEAPEFDAFDTVDCEGRLVTPGLIDCHTHLVYGGDRSHEFEQRLQGVSYEEIARAGGGILSTMAATRALTQEALTEAALPRLDALINEGATTVEIKSGYGLSVLHELKQLRAARALPDHRSVNIRTTLLAAHALPPEFKDDVKGYLDLICGEMIPAVAHTKLADAVDGFCETIGFSVPDIRRMFGSAQAHGLKIKLHAEQLSNQGGAALAAQFGAVSADHLEYVDEAGVKAMAEAGTAAVLLPGAFYFTRETRLPPVDLLRRHGVRIALATDCNPGTSPLTSLLLVMNMGATLFRLTVEECIAGVTREAARALGFGHAIGTLETGKWCDLAVWDVERPAELVYRMGFNPLHKRFRRGA